MNASIRDALHKMALAMAHLWLWQTWLQYKELPIPHTMWVYDRDLGWGGEELKGKRVQVKIEVVDHRPGS